VEGQLFGARRWGCGRLERGDESRRFRLVGGGALPGAFELRRSRARVLPGVVPHVFGEPPELPICGLFFPVAVEHVLVGLDAHGRLERCARGAGAGGTLDALEGA